jgi:hypothetical protein
MLLKPKHIEPGWARRWPREAVALVGPNFHLWFALMIAATVLAVGLAHLPFRLLTILVLGVVTYKLSQELAVAAEHGQVGLGQVGGMLVEAVRATGPELARNRFLVTIVVAMSLLVAAGNAGLLGAPAVPPQEASGMPSLAELVFYWKPLVAASWLYTLGMLTSARPAIGGVLVYPLQRMHGVNFDQAARLVSMGARRNIKAVIGGDALLFLGGLVLLTLLPVALPFLLCLGPAVSYVACREMFGPGAPLHRKQTQSVFKPVLES